MSSVTNADGSVTVTLSRPITVIDQTVSVVTLREPLGRDFTAAGDPADKMAYGQRLAEILGQLPIGTLASMRGRDVMKLTGVVGNVFLADDPPPASSTDTSNAPTSGGATPAIH